MQAKWYCKLLMSVFNNITAWSPQLMRYDSLKEIFFTVSTDQWIACNICSRVWCIVLIVPSSSLISGPLQGMRVHSCLLIWTTMSNASSLTHSPQPVLTFVWVMNYRPYLNCFKVWRERKKINIWVITISTQFLVKRYCCSNKVFGY